MKNTYILPLLVLLTSCTVEPTVEPTALPSNTVPVYGDPHAAEIQRFTVTKHGKFDAGYGDNTREILIITDTFTKKTYLGVTGVGVTEMRVEKETSIGFDGENITTDTTSKTVER